MADHETVNNTLGSFSIPMQSDFLNAGREQEVNDFARPLLKDVCPEEELLNASVGLTETALQVFKDGPEREFFAVDGPEVDQVFRQHEQGQNVYAYKDGDKIFVAECRPPPAIF